MASEIDNILKKVDSNVAHHIVKLIGEDKEVKIRPMTMKHFKILLKSSEGINRESLLKEAPEEVKKIDTIFDAVMKDCVVEPADFDPLELFSADWYYLLVMLRTVSKGSTIDFNMQCMGTMESTSGSIPCKERLKLSIDLNELEKASRKKLDVKINLPGKIKVHFSPPKRKDAYVLNDYMIEKGSSPVEEPILRIVSCIDWVEHDGNKVTNLSLDDKMKIFERFSYLQKKEIQKGYDQLSFGIPMLVDIKCNKCGYEVRERLVDLADFFIL